ncbi:MAG: amino acid adenylation domain-containing protein, partial [Bacteroidales bacterium]|nr:amino acid adenylation domain-containing protein [Bacteroidales bacterium]
MAMTSPLSKTQYGIYAECAGHSGEICYNLPYLYTLDRSLDTDRLCRAVETVVANHPTLFTRLTMGDDGEPQQYVDLPAKPWTLRVEEIADINEVRPTLPQPFNLFEDNLFRIRLLRDAGHLYLFADYHHIIVDGTSMHLMLEEIDKAYHGIAPEPEEMTLAEAAQQETTAMHSDAYEAAKDWYAQHFDCGDVSTPLIADREEKTPTESSLLRTLHIDDSSIAQFCKSHGIFRSTLFTSAYAFLLSKFNNDPDALFTTVYNGRQDPRLRNTVGMFVKTLPVYTHYEADSTVLDFLNAQQEQMSQCRQNDIYPFSEMLEDLHLHSHSMFAWHATLFADDQMGDRPMKAERIGNSTLDVPLYLKAFIRDGHYQVKAEYNGAEYSEALIGQFLESYEAVVAGMLTHERLADIDIATREQVQLLDRFNETDVDYDATQTIVTLFARQAKATPTHTAVVFKERSYTYVEVDELSNRIAGYLTEQGLGEGHVVSVLIPRCEWMAIASLGILKTGCAYQPLDPSYPKERLNFMMQDADTRLLISLDPEAEGKETESTWLQGLDVIGERSIPVLDLKQIDQLKPCPDYRAASITPESLFILLYTSGSTGVPKGCQLTHGNLVAFCHWYQRYYTLRAEHRVAAYASYGFDACMMDLYPALTCGASVYIIYEDIRLDLVALNEYFEQNHITHSFMTTQVGYQFATSVENHSLLYLSTGGEKLASLTPPTGYKFYNAYGPTECTIYTTTYCVEKKMKEIPIGKALDNMRLYVVDPQGHRLPVGAAGELWISGPQVSRGYLNRPEKTAETYIDNPFVDKASPTENDRKYQRVYRSGDIVRFLPDGNIQFIGRRDGQ